uniref:DDE Tnp4 domain-containing protein n=1 Tax=Pelusios castaneus TaxID=367368 RepID=A0A8C8RP66_9SAUR
MAVSAPSPIICTWCNAVSGRERRETSTEWWDRIVMQLWDDEQWVQNFRMRKATFLELCSELAPALRRKDTNMRSSLTVEKRVAIALWKMVTPDCYRSVANQFGVGRSTVGVALTQVCTAINRVLLRRTVTLGNVSEIVDGFAAMGFPNCGGAIDGTHIPILAPDHLATEYINRKGYFSMVLQALVDHRGRFTDINAGWSGKVHDARIFRNSGLYRKLQGVILGVPAYPLMPWLMKPYTGNLDQSKERFNYRLSRSRMTVECAFGRLKGRWRCLYGRLDLSENNIPAVIASCCVLHNICENRGERFCPVWETEAQRLEEAYEQPATRSIRGDKGEASRIREALREHFSHALP